MRSRSVVLGTLSVVSMLATLLIAPAPSGAQEEPLFTTVEAFATKTGFRGVFAWEASQPVEVTVRYGTDPDNLDRIAGLLPTTADTAGMAVAYLYDPETEADMAGATFHYELTDELTGTTSGVGSFTAANAYNDFDGDAYTIDLLVQLDSQSLPPDIPADLALDEIAQGLSITAERIYDALDGHARLGTVLVTDTNLDHAANVPFLPPACFTEHSNLADVLVQTTVPFDSHTFGGWMIDEPCISFYVGRLGQLVIPWADDLHFGYVSAHELMHYGFDAPDLYPANSDADCRNLDWDGSLMHNTGGWNGTRWELTELDRNPDLTPCDHGSQPYSWDVLRERYTEVPLNADGPIDHVVDTQARGNDDGGALDILVLDREPGSSTLDRVTPSDAAGAECTTDGPQVTDPQGDANGFVVTGTPGPSDPSLDVLEGRFTWDGEALTAHITVDDLTDDPPTGAPGRYNRFYFTHDGTEYYLVAARDPRGAEFRLVDNAAAATVASGLNGAFDAEADEIRVTLPADTIGIAEGDRLDGLEILAQRYYVVLTPTADQATGSCPYVVGQEDADEEPTSQGLAIAEGSRPEGRGRPDAS